MPNILMGMYVAARHLRGSPAPIGKQHDHADRADSVRPAPARSDDNLPFDLTDLDETGARPPNPGWPEYTDDGEDETIGA